MTLHIVLGEGEMPAKELTAALNDLKKRDEAADVNHWWYVHGKSEPTATDRGIIAWLNKHDVWYGVVTSDADSLDPIYSEAVETEETKRLAPAIVGLLTNGPDEGEDADLLALFASDDYSSESDRWLNDVGRAVQDAGFEVFAFNDGMIPMDFSDIEPATDDEESPLPPVTELKSKKAPPVVEDDEEIQVPDSPAGIYTREALEAMEIPALKEIAANLGITVAPRSRIQTYINAILGEGAQEPGEVETEPVAPKPLPLNTTATTTANATATYETVEISSPAMLIVVFNGSVVARPIPLERAQALINAPLG